MRMTRKTLSSLIQNEAKRLGLVENVALDPSSLAPMVQDLGMQVEYVMEMVSQGQSEEALNALRDVADALGQIHISLEDMAPGASI